MTIPAKVRRRSLLGAGIVGGGAALYGSWSPGIWEGTLPTPGGNAAWLEHGWLGNARWFQDNRGGPEHMDRYRATASIYHLRDRLMAHGVRDTYPHLTPTSKDGALPSFNPDTMNTFVKAMQPINVMPWVGGVINQHVFPDSPTWTSTFIASVRSMLSAAPDLDGVHVNLEPWPGTSEQALELLRALRDAMPSNKRLSVATFPPDATLFRGTTWSTEYHARVTGIADQVAVMLYNSSLWLAKPYVWTVERVVTNALQSSRGASVVLGVPTYDSEATYHLECVENLETVCAGIRGALARLPSPPPCYQGVAVYAAWETDQAEWERLNQQLNGGG